MMTTTITPHPLMASAIRMAVVTTGALQNASAPLSTMAMPAMYAGPDYCPYVGRALKYGPASACPIREAVRQITCIDLVGVKAAGVPMSKTMSVKPNEKVMLALAPV